MKNWTEEQEKEYQERKQWFLDRVGKRVFREETSCPCESCKRNGNNGLIIANEMHAIYLQDIENMYNAKGHKLKYRDERNTAQ